MKLADFDYHLPSQLIADQPQLSRSDSRLLVVPIPNGSDSAVEEAALFQHLKFSQILRYLSPGDLLVINDTKVIKARLLGKKDTGGQIEVFVERILDDASCLAFIRASKAPKVGQTLLFNPQGGQASARVIEKADDRFRLTFNLGMSLLEFLGNYGETPLPPYMKRPASTDDEERYQTVYAAKPGAVAAPTAGLHFTHELLESIKSKGVQVATVTLHVGAGTFLPVRSEDILSHQMHAEYLEVNDSLVKQVADTKKNGGNVVAVGTTSVRALETASQDGVLKPYQGDSRLFIYPGFEFQCVDALITNFHLPKSTLLMLVSAIAGRERILAAYHEAIENRYRFFSYGDAMFIAPNHMLNPMA